MKPSYPPVSIGGVAVYTRATVVNLSVAVLARYEGRGEQAVADTFGAAGSVGLSEALGGAVQSEHN